MAEEKKTQQQSAVKEKELQKETIAKYGGFALLETTVDGLQNMNPERKARRNIFLTEDGKKDERDNLAQRLNLWIDILKNNDEAASMVEACNEKTSKIDTTLRENISKALEVTKELETNYRSVNLFYKNAEAKKIKNISILNADSDQITDLDTSLALNIVGEELGANYDRLDLKDNYSMLVLPGYLGSKKVVDAWAREAYKNKTMLLTDYRDLDSVDDVVELFEEANLTGGDGYLSNVIMSCNYLVGRERDDEYGEEDGVFVPPSTSMAGKLYTTLMSQISAGRSFGSLNDVDGVKFPLKKSEISHLDKIGLVPMVNEYGKVMAFSGKTLFNGDNIGMKTYSVVRVFDYISKVLVDFLNRRAFENWNANTKKDLRKQIIGFLDSVKGPKGLIEKWEIRKLDQDPIDKDKINLDIHIKPYFPAKTFLVQLEGTKGEDIEEITWESDYAMQG